MADATGILGSLRIVVDADTKKAISQLDTLGGKAKLVGVAVAGGLGIAAKGALEMEDRQAAFQAATGASEDEARHFSDQLNALAGRSLVPMDTLADSMTAIRTDLNLTGAAADTAAEQFARYERATGQGADAVLAFDDILDAWNLEATDSQGIMDVLIKSHQLYGGSIEENQKLLAQLAPVLQAANLSWEEGQGLINLFARAGVDAATASTAFSKALRNVESPEELQQLIKDISSIQDPFERAQRASEVFGAKAGPKLAQALSDSDGQLDKFAVSVGEAASATDKAADALDSTLTSRIKLITNQAMAALRGFGMELGPILTAAFSAVSLGKAFGLDKVLGPIFERSGKVVGPLFAKAAAASMALVDWGVGLAKVGWDKLGALYGGKFGVAFRIAAVAAAALIWVEVINQYNNFLNTVKAKNDEIAAEATRAIAEGTDSVLTVLENRAAAMKNANPIQRAIQDSFQQEQMLTELADFGRALSTQANLTGDQIARGISALDSAIVESVARGNESVTASLERAKADLQARWDALAPEDRASKATAAQLESMGAMLGGAAQQSVEDVIAKFQTGWQAWNAKLKGAFSGPVEEETQATVAAIKQGFGNIKSALANPPQLISNEVRIENLDKKWNKVNKNLRRAVEVNDTAGIKYWGKAVESIQRRQEHLRHATAKVTEDTAKGSEKGAGRAKKAGTTAATAVSKANTTAGKVVEKAHAHASAVAVNEANRARTGVVAAAQSMATGVNAALSNINLTSGGLSVGQTFANGIRLAIPAAISAAMAMATAVKKVLGASMPTEGPLVHIDEGGKSVGQAWSRGLHEGVGTPTIGARIATALRPMPRGLVGAGVGGQVHYHIGTLIANDEGIDELDRRAENRRRLRRRGHDPAND